MTEGMMKNLRYVALVASLIALVAVASGAAVGTTAGEPGWYVIHANIFDVKVYLDDKYVGTIGQGKTGVSTLTVPADANGTPYRKIRAQKYGYSTYLAELPAIPVSGGTVDVYATLTEIPLTTPGLAVDSQGWYIVRCNVDGATVYFDDADRGTIAQGVLYVPVYTTAAPYRTYVVKKDGYSTFTGNIPTVPGRGGSVDLYATLNPLAQPVSSGTPQLIGGDTGWFVVHSNVEGATVSFDNDPKGTITNGTLRLLVYVTGTPYRSYAVYKPGYVPFTGAIDARPGKGEIVDLNAVLSPESAGPAAAVPATKTPVPAGIAVSALFIGGIASLFRKKSS